MNKAVAYLRVSTDNQAQEDRYGLDIQRNEVDAYAKRNNIMITAYYIDAGESGAKLNRPELDRMLKNAEAKIFNQVIVAKLDRIARDTFAQLWIEKELLKSNVEIVSVAEPMRASDPAGQLFRTMIAAFATFERARINERMTAGRLQKAQQGGFAGGRVPMGYALDKNSNVLVINPDKADTIKLVFKLRGKGQSFQEIADNLNRYGHTTALNKSFTKNQVKRICDRERLYAGHYSYAGVKTKGQHEAIL